MSSRSPARGSGSAPTSTGADGVTTWVPVGGWLAPSPASPAVAAPAGVLPGPHPVPAALHTRTTRAVPTVTTSWTRRAPPSGTSTVSDGGGPHSGQPLRRPTWNVQVRLQALSTSQTATTTPRAREMAVPAGDPQRARRAGDAQAQGSNQHRGQTHSVIHIVFLAATHRTESSVAGEGTVSGRQEGSTRAGSGRITSASRRTSTAADLGIRRSLRPAPRGAATRPCRRRPRGRARGRRPGEASGRQTPRRAPPGRHPA